MTENGHLGAPECGGSRGEISGHSGACQASGTKLDTEIRGKTWSRERGREELAQQGSSSARTRAMLRGSEA